MKRGRTSWLIKLSPAVRRRVYAAIDADQPSAREIYNQYNLRRFTPFNTFRKTYTQRRKALADRMVRAAESESSESKSETAARGGGNAAAGGGVDAAIANCVNAITDKILTGRTGKLSVSRALGSLATLKGMRLRELADRRAQELHEAKMADAAEQLDVMESNNELTAEQVAEIRLKVLGL